MPLQRKRQLHSNLQNQKKTPGRVNALYADARPKCDLRQGLDRHRRGRSTLRAEAKDFRVQLNQPVVSSRISLVAHTELEGIAENAVSLSPCDGLDPIQQFLAVLLLIH